MRRLASVLLASALLAACGDSLSPEGVSGLYILETINGSPLPFSEIVTPTLTVVTTAGSVSLNANSTYSASITLSITVDGTTTTSTETDSGTFELVEPSTVRFTGSATGLGETFSGTLDGNQLTIIEAGDTFVLRK